MILKQIRNVIQYKLDKNGDEQKHTTWSYQFEDANEGEKRTITAEKPIPIVKVGDHFSVEQVANLRPGFLD